MNIVDTISLQVKVWQLFGLSNLKHISTKELIQSRNIFVVLTTFGQLAGINRMFRHAKIYRYSFGHLIYSLLIMFMSTIVRILNMVIFVELFAKTDKQAIFLDKITEIDSQLKKCLNIDVNYPYQKQRYKQLFLRFLFIGIIPHAIMGIGRFAFVDALAVHKFMASIVFQLIALRFNQYTTYVDMIGWRYSLINRYINDFYGIDVSQWVIHGVRPISTIPTAIHLQRLEAIDMICRRLSKASEHANKMFPWSLSLCVFHEFCVFFTYGQDIARSSYRMANGEGNPWSVVSVFFCFASLNNFLSLAHVCDRASNEVGSMKSFGRSNA